MKLKIGDYVKFNYMIFGNGTTELVEDRGFITSISESPWGDSYMIKVDGKEKEVRVALQTPTHVRVKANKISRKLYPNKEEKEGWIYL